MPCRVAAAAGGPSPSPSPGPTYSAVAPSQYVGAALAQEAAAAIMATFGPFFASDKHRKVWHNYSFDRHVLELQSLPCAGFAGDTMHMARLWDSARTAGRGGYGLEALSSEQMSRQTSAHRLILDQKPSTASAAASAMCLPS